MIIDRWTMISHAVPRRLALATLVLTTISWSPAAASSKDAFDKAYAEAVAVEAEAGRIRNQWTSTQDALEAARKDGLAGDFQDGERQAALAKAMALRSIEQATEQREAWHAAVIGADRSADAGSKKTP